MVKTIEVKIGGSWNNATFNVDDYVCITGCIKFLNLIKKQELTYEMVMLRELDNIYGKHYAFVDRGRFISIDNLIALSYLSDNPLYNEIINGLTEEQKSVLRDKKISMLI